MPAPIIEEIRTGDVERVRAAIDADPKRATGAQAVNAAGARASIPILQLLREHGADLNGVFRGYRALHNLMQEREHGPGSRPEPERPRCLEWMLANGADPELPGGWPPARALVCAAFTGIPEYVDVMRHHGARYDGFAAAACGDLNAVEAALKNHPEFANARDTGGLTALQCASGSRLRDSNRVEVARALIDAGADVRAKTKSWSHEIDAVYLAANAHNLPLFELLLDRGGDPNDALTCAVWNATEEFAEAAMARGANPDRAVSADRPLLNDLIRWGRFQQAYWLLARGASPNVADKRGWTALDQAESRGNANMIRALKDAGGDPKVRRS